MTTTQHYTNRHVPAADIPADAVAVYWIARESGKDEDVTVYFKKTLRAAKMAFARDRGADCVERGWGTIIDTDRKHGLMVW